MQKKLRLLAKNQLLLFALLILVLPAVWSLFRPGFFPSDDGEWMVIRLSDFHRSFVSGQIPVRWAARLNHGYGYPVFNFLYPLPFYMGEFFHLLGCSFVNSIKLVFIFSFFLSSFLMYFFARKVLGKWGGLVAALFYVYAPYRFLDVYVRGSIGEAVSFIFVPLIFWMLYKLALKTNWAYVVFGAFGLAGLIMSHNITAMLFIPIIFFYAALQIWLSKDRKQLAIHYLSFFILALGLSCFFWLPAFYDKQFIILDKITVANFWEHFPSLKQLLFSSWGYGPSVVGTADQASYQLGLLHLLAVIMAAVFLIKFWRKENQKRIQTLFFVLIFLGAVFLMFPFSTPIWKIIPMLWRTQFPWRFLAVTTFASAFLSGALVQMMKPKFQTIAVVFFIILLILLNYRYAKPQFFVNRSESFYTTNEATTTVKDEFMPIWVIEKPTVRAERKVEIITGKGSIKNLFFNSKKTTFVVWAETEVEIQVNTVYFPGWQVKIDNQETTIDFKNSQGLIKFKVPTEEHQVIAEFKETPLRLFADTVSLLSLFFCGGLLFKKRKKNK